MNTGLGGATGYGENSFVALGAQTGDLDDGSRFVDFTSVFGASGVDYFGTNYTGIYINTNGLLTFDSPNTAYSSTGIDEFAEPAIAPFWTDIDISAGGDIIWDLDPANGTVTITWLDVAPYSGAGTNSFQVVLTDTGNGDFDFEFIYEDIQFTSGSGGSPHATAGATDGGSNDFVVEGSGNAGDLAGYATNDFDTGDPAGVVSFSVSGGQISDGTVSGTAGNDDIGVGFTDSDGDAVTTGDDTIDAGTGDDTIDGGAGDDSILGGAGDDRILIGSGNDTADGGDGADTFVFSDGYGDVVVTGGSGGIDTDTIDLSALTGPVTVTFSDEESGTISDGTNTISFSDIETLTLTDQSDMADASSTHSGRYGDHVGVNIDGGGGDDTLLGGRGGDTLVGGGGNDSVDGDYGDDSLAGGDGNDTLTGGTGNDTMEGGDGHDSLTADEEADTLIGGAGNDTLDGGSGDDSIDGGTGADVIDGGDGADTIDGGDGADSIDAGAGDDSIDYATGGDTVFGGDGNDTLRGGFTAGEDDAELHGGAGDDSIVTYGADDTVYGDAGADFIGADSGNEYLDGGIGNDTIFAGNGDDTVFGGDGNDSIDGGSGNDTIDAGIGDDNVQAGSGNDSVQAGSGNDSVNLGDGNDTVEVLHSDGGTDTIHGGDGLDEIDFDSLGVEGIDVTLTGDYDGSFDFATSGQGTFTSFEEYRLTSKADTFDGSASTAGVDLEAGDGDDSILGGSGGDKFSAGAGDDTLDGGAGNDTLLAKEGNDSLIGGDGDDSLYSGTGTSTLDGGSGNDFLEVDEDDGAATVIGGSGFDELDFDSDAAAGVSVTFTGDGAGTFAFGDGGATGAFSEIEEIDGTGNDDTIDASADTSGIDFDGQSGDDQITGGSGHDTIEGGLGSDTLTGGAGDDTFIYNAGSGSDTITDFNAGNSGALGDGNSENNDYIDLSGFYDNLSELRADFDDDGVLNQSNSTSNGGDVDYSNNVEMQAGDGLTFSGADRSSFTADNTGVMCFTAGTAIATPRGDVLIEDLKVDDLVITLDNGPQRIRWIGRRDLGPDMLSRNPNLRPVLIRKSVLGAARDMLVSRQHGMLVQDRLVRATHLTDQRGIRVANGKRRVTYFHLMFDDHQIIFAENTPSESFYPGPMGLATLSASGRAALFTDFPALSQIAAKPDAITHYGAVARRFAARRERPLLLT